MGSGSPQIIILYLALGVLFLFFGGLIWLAWVMDKITQIESEQDWEGFDPTKR